MTGDILSQKEGDLFAEIPENARKIAVYDRTGEKCKGYTSSHVVPGQYKKLISAQPGRHYVGFYHDTGKKNMELDKLIEDCRAKKIDLVIVKCVSRISGTLLETLDIIRQLTDIGVGMYFEYEMLYTLADNANIDIIVDTLTALEAKRLHDLYNSQKRAYESCRYMEESYQVPN